MFSALRRAFGGSDRPDEGEPSLGTAHGSRDIVHLSTDYDSARSEEEAAFYAHPDLELLRSLPKIKQLETGGCKVHSDIKLVEEAHIAALALHLKTHFKSLATAAVSQQKSPLTASDRVEKLATATVPKLMRKKYSMIAFNHELQHLQAVYDSLERACGGLQRAVVGIESLRRLLPPDHTMESFPDFLRAEAKAGRTQRRGSKRSKDRKGEEDRKREARETERDIKEAKPATTTEARVGEERAGDEADEDEAEIAVEEAEEDADDGESVKRDIEVAKRAEMNADGEPAKRAETREPQSVAVGEPVKAAGTRELGQECESSSRSAKVTKPKTKGKKRSTKQRKRTGRRQSRKKRTSTTDL